MRLWLSLVTLCSGCDRLFGLSHLDQADDDGGLSCGAVCDAPLPVPPRLLISEVSVAGLDSPCGYDDTDELVEIYNPEALAASTAGLALECAPSTSATFVRCAELPAEATIAAHGFYLIGGIGLGGDSCGYTNPIPDLIMTGTLHSDSGAVRLVGAGGVVVDRVAWGASLAGEGNALAPWPPPTWSQFFNSVERKATVNSTAASMSLSGAEASAGNAYDSGDNNADFVFRNGRNPQTTASPVEPP